jgi:hypothetical protein
VPNSGLVFDDCGVCNGGNADNLGCGCFEPGPSGCDNECGSILVDDECGVCGGDSSDDAGCGCFEPGPSGCDNECGSTLVDDECGVCGGDSSDDAGCGCFEPGPSGCDNECGSTLVDDECGECGGDNSTCTDCALVINGTALIDECGDCIDPVCNYLGIPSPFTAGMNPCDGDEFPISILWNASCLSIENLIPKNSNINSIYPNPFNPITTINYSIAIFSEVNISIYSIDGKLIQILVNSSQQPGQYAVQWNASNFPSGLYFVKLISSNKKAEQKVLLIK